MAKLFLNEWTEIEVKETSEQILELTQEKKQEEKASGASDNLIKLTRKIEKVHYTSTKKRKVLFEDQTIFLYMKRVLFFYD